VIGRSGSSGTNGCALDMNLAGGDIQRVVGWLCFIVFIYLKLVGTMQIL
jgi:hypothetical protein